MKRFRILLYLPAIILEVFLILFCIVGIVISVNAVGKVMWWVDTWLPGHSWYFEGFKNGTSS